MKVQFRVAPSDHTYNKTLGNMAPAACQASRRGPQLVPFSSEPPARLGGEGLAQEIPPPRKKEREKEREAKARAQCHCLAPLGSRRWPQWPAWGLMGRPDVPEGVSLA